MYGGKLAAGESVLAPTRLRALRYYLCQIRYYLRDFGYCLCDLRYCLYVVSATAYAISATDLVYAICRRNAMRCPVQT